MRRSLVLTSALVLVAAAAPAIAGGLNEPAPDLAPVAPAPAPVIVATSDWTGFYAGGSFGNIDVDADGADFDEGTGFGIHGGYLADLGTFVIGGELEFSRYDLDATSAQTDVTRIKARAGYDAGQFLPYVTAGFASVNSDDLDIDSASGYFLGLGAEIKATDNILVGVEYLDHTFEDVDSGVGTIGELEAGTLGLQVSYQF